MGITFRWSNEYEDIFKQQTRDQVSTKYHKKSVIPFLPNNPSTAAVRLGCTWPEQVVPMCTSRSIIHLAIWNHVLDLPFFLQRSPSQVYTQTMKPGKWVNRIKMDKQKPFIIMRYLHPILIYPLSEFNWQAFCTLQAPWWGYKCHKYISKTNIMNTIGPGNQKDGFGTGGIPGLVTWSQQQTSL